LAREINKLTPRKIASLTKPGRYGDGLGLELQVSQWATKAWVLRFTRNGKTRCLGLGPLHTVSLAEARERARQARQVILDGRDPIDAKREARRAEQLAAARKMTFRQCAAAYIAEHSGNWSNPKHAAQWSASVERASGAFGDLDVGAIDTDVLIKFLAPIWRATPESASRLRGRIEAILDWAGARGFRQGENCARWRGHLEHLLKAKPPQKHLAALPVAELPAFMAELRGRAELAARALEFTILTAARTGEAMGARWDEIDFAAKVWTLPAERMKSGRQHRVPLTDRLLAILADLPRDGGPLLFPGVSGSKPMHNGALLNVLKEISELGCG
jgi:integrase